MSSGLVASFVLRFPTGQEVRVENLQTPAEPGVTVLFGASGAGKTSILRCLAGLERPAQGTILFEDLVWLDAAQGRFLPPCRRQVGFVPQDYGLFPHLSVQANIAYGLQRLAPAERRERLEQAFQWLGLQGLENRAPATLSGGQQQRVALARAVVCRPRLLLLDEPLSALDGPTRLRLRAELGRWLRQWRIPTLLVTHERSEVLALGDELVVLEAGRMLQRGPVRQVFSQPASLAVAAIVGVETVQPGRVLQVNQGLVSVQVGPRTLLALAPELPEGVSQVYACIRAEDVILLKGPPVQSSPRNCWLARVRGLSAEGPMLRVELDCGFALAALLTRQACEELALAEGQEVLALVKAPQIHLLPRA